MMTSGVPPSDSADLLQRNLELGVGETMRYEAHVRSLSISNDVHFIVAISLGLICLLGGIAAAQGIVVNETGLHDYEEAYGIDASAAVDPVTNTLPISLSAAGETNPSLFANVSFYAYGILTSGPTLTNSGALSVNATGGQADANDLADSYAFAEAYGINVIRGNVDNSAAITVQATGGTADANEVEFIADATSETYGIHSEYGLITNSGVVDVNALGGTALSGATGETMDDTSASSWAYGLYSEDGAIENTADVNAVATGGTAISSETDSRHALDASARAYGLYADIFGMDYTHPNRHVSNSGNLTVTATAGSTEGSVEEAGAVARAYGIESDKAPVINSGRVTVTAAGGNALSTSSNNMHDTPEAYASAWAYGIRAHDAGANNSGTVVASAIGGTATGQGAAGAYADAEVVAIEADGTGADLVRVQVQNTGAVTATATGGAATSASASASADADVTGLETKYAYVENSGAITVTGQGGAVQAAGDAYAHVAAVGLTASYGVLDNSGDIAVAGTGGTAEGRNATAYVYAFGLTATDARTNNSGDITVTAEAGDVTCTDRSFAMAYAAGIGADQNDVTNSGDIAVTARGGTAGSGDMANAFAYGIRARNANVDNSGDITVAATAQDGFTSEAFGILFQGTGTLTNTGIIRASGDTAYELYVEDDATLTLVDRYNVTLDGDPNNASIHVGERATLALDNATLTVASVRGETLWDTPYQLFDAEPNGVVDGSFAAAQALNPNTTATYYDQNSVDSSDDKVALSYTPGASAALPSTAVEKQVVTQAIDVVNTHMTSLMLHDVFSSSSGALLADAGATARSMGLAQSGSDDEVGVFFEPYYSRVDRDADPMGYDARLWGFAAGYERRLDNTLVGLHMGYGRANVDYTGAGYGANSEDQDILTGGLSGLTRWDEWTLRYSLIGFYGWHDYKGLTGATLNANETASTDSYGLNASVMAGHIFRRGPHVFLPEAGLNWLWAHRQRYTTEASDPAWNTTYSAMDDHDLQAEAAIRWLGGFMAGDIHVSPSASIGVRHLLTDAESTVSQSVAGTAPVLVRSERDRTAVTTSGSIVLSQGSQALSLAYDGEYSSDTDRHSFWLRYAWTF